MVGNSNREPRHLSLAVFLHWSYSNLKMRTFNGTGMMLYGMRDVNPDGSYIATKWVTILWLPIFPLGSFRVWPGKTEYGGIVVARSSTPYKLAKANFNWAQVAATYLVMLLVLAVLYVLGLVLKW